MLRDKEEKVFTKSKVVGNDRQITVTIPSNDWKFFPPNSKVNLITKEGIAIRRNIMEQGCGKQRYINIPQNDWDLFKKGDIVRIYPLNVK